MSLQSPYIFAGLFADDPAAILRTQEIADRCSFSLAEIRYRYPSEHMPNGMTSADWLRHLTFEAVHERYDSGIPGDVVDQVEKELKIIEALDYPGYFLTMREIVEILPGKRHTLPRTRLRGKFGGLLLPRRHGRRSSESESPIRTLHLKGEGRASGHRSRHPA